MPKIRLLNQVRNTIRALHYTVNTTQIYTHAETGTDNLSGIFLPDSRFTGEQAETLVHRENSGRFSRPEYLRCYGLPLSVG